MKAIGIPVKVVLVLAAAASAGAADLAVTSSADSGPGTLREAVAVAEANGEPDVITFAADMTVVLASPLPPITTEITIVGRGWESTVIDGGNPPGGATGVRPFHVTSSGVLVLDSVMVQNGYSMYGGGVWNEGSFTFRNSFATANTAVTYGGFLIATGTAAVEGSLVVGNDSGHGGGGLWAEGSQPVLTVLRSSVSENEAGVIGGGIGLASATLLVRDVVLEGNASIGGAALGCIRCVARLANTTLTNNSGPEGAVTTYLPTADVVLTHSTVTGNTSTQQGVLWGYEGRLELRDSLVAGNTGTSCVGVTSGGGNIEDAATCGGSPALGDMMSTDPMLGPYTGLWRGGVDLTYYHPIDAASPAVDSATTCSWDHDGDPGTAEAALAGDQRRLPRPQDGDGDGAAACDRGAVEYHGLIFLDGVEAGDTSAWSATTP